MEKIYLCKIKISYSINQKQSSMNPLEKLSFLEELNKKTVTWHHGVLQPNMGGNPMHIKTSEFTRYVISESDFKKVLKIIHDEILLVVPKETLMGYIEGYDVRDLQYKLLLRFGEKNIPKESGFTLQKLFTCLVRSRQNVEICKQLDAEGLKGCIIKKTFEDYCY